MLRLKATRIGRTIRRWHRWTQIEDQTPVFELQAAEIHNRAFGQTRGLEIADDLSCMVEPRFQKPVFVTHYARS